MHGPAHTSEHSMENCLDLPLSLFQLLYMRGNPLYCDCVYRSGTTVVVARGVDLRQNRADSLLLLCVVVPSIPGASLHFGQHMFTSLTPLQETKKKVVPMAGQGNAAYLLAKDRRLTRSA